MKIYSDCLIEKYKAVFLFLPQKALLSRPLKKKEKYFQCFSSLQSEKISAYEK